MSESDCSVCFMRSSEFSSRAVTSVTSFRLFDVVHFIEFFRRRMSRFDYSVPSDRSCSKDSPGGRPQASLDDDEAAREKSSSKTAWIVVIPFGDLLP